MRRITPTSRLLLSALLTLLALACTADRLTPEDTPSPETAVRAVRVCYTLPEMNEARLRAMTAEEMKIKTLRLLVFRATAGAPYSEATLAYTAAVTKLNAPDAEGKGTMTALLEETPGGMEDYFVLVANEGSTSPTSASLIGQTIGQAMPSFVFRTPIATDALPMFGISLKPLQIALPQGDSNESVVITLNEGDPVILTRAVAKVAVGFGWDQNRQRFSDDGDFDLVSVSYHNMSDRGYVAPLPVEIEEIMKDTFDPFDGPAFIKDVPGVPAAVTPVSAPLDTTAPFYVPEAINRDKGAIHVKGDDTFVTTKPEADIEEYAKRPCIVIGVRPKGVPSDPVTYYRIDFVGTGEAVMVEPSRGEVIGEKTEGLSPEEQGDGKQPYHYIDIRRNISYIFNITGIYGPGYSATESALYGPALNIRYNVEIWEDSDDLHVIQTDGRFRLAAGTDHLTLSRDGSTVSLPIRTDKGTKWSATLGEDSSWLSVTPTNTEGGVGSLSISATPNTTGSSRAGSIVIECRRLSLSIQVIQEA